MREDKLSLGRPFDLDRVAFIWVRRDLRQTSDGGEGVSERSDGRRGERATYVVVTLCVDGAGRLKVLVEMVDVPGVERKIREVEARRDDEGKSYSRTLTSMEPETQR